MSKAAKQPAVDLAKIKYILDTGIFIEFADKGNYSKKVFPSLWQEFDELIQNAGIVVAPHDVFLELSKAGDWISAYAKKHRQKLFVLPDQNVQKHLIEIQTKLPDWQKKIGLWADPVVIALAMATGAKVVTSEQERPGRIRVPHVCKQMGVTPLRPIQFFGEMGWKI